MGSKLVLQQYSLLIGLFFWSLISLSAQHGSIQNVKLSPMVYFGQPQNYGIRIDITISNQALTTYQYPLALELIHQGRLIGQQQQEFTYLPPDSSSLSQLLDSLAPNIALAVAQDSLVLDSLPFGSDTIWSFFLPYRSLALETGNHKLLLNLKTPNQEQNLYSSTVNLEQVPLYDLFLELEKGIIQLDSGVNPLSLSYRAPDPKWLVHLGNSDFHGLKHKNAFECKSKSIETTIADGDALSVCIHNADPSSQEDLVCWEIPHGNAAYEQTYKDASVSKRLQAVNFQVKKIRRLPPETDFRVKDGVSYRGVQGIQLDFTYSLPLSYKRYQLRINLLNQHYQALKNFITIKEKRVQEGHRIVAHYQYFIAYYELQKSDYVQLLLSANDQHLAQHQTKGLSIQRAVRTANFKQTVGHQRNGISGILYELNFDIAYLPEQGQLEVVFPNFPAQSLSPIEYWTSTTANKIQQGAPILLPNATDQQVFIFLPYFAAPSLIEPSPQLRISSLGLPSMLLYEFRSRPYNRPSSLNDIQIHTTSHAQSSWTGLSGYQVDFAVQIPAFYHSKGYFDLLILENDSIYKGQVVLNNSIGNNLRVPIYQQKRLSVFLPARALKKDAKYKVKLQAKNEAFILSEPRQEQFIHQDNQAKSIQLYLERLDTRQAAEFEYTIGVRNYYNYNNTYPQLSYQTLLKEQIQTPYKPDFPKAHDFDLVPKDELVIWLQPIGQGNQASVQFSTTLEEIEQNKGRFEVLDHPLFKRLVLRILVR